ncbi:MAG TPA: diaminopimelate decarboxylase [Chthoniobacterales bacterium]|jgi:diaminopimelate decarboxylase|nr:diaminopimelate decarboxylase [Chthoniobacterales bacterium]
MHSFHYRGGQLYCEEVSLSGLAEQFGTPLYVYSAGTILDHYRRLDQALAPLDHLICYAVKANSNGAILSRLAEAGAGFDIVSGGELFRVLKAGGAAAKCTFAGVGKSREEIEYALAEGVFSFNVESEAELEWIDCIAREKGTRAPVALRVNPDVDASTHRYISTGKSENKFGVALHRAREVYEKAARMPGVSIRGIQMHIGSQITKAAPFAEAIEKVAPLIAELKARHGLEFFSVGGGMGIIYRRALESGTGKWWHDHGGEESAFSVADYREAIVPPLREIGLRALLEPGRFLVGNAGVLVSRIRYLKQAEKKKFAIVDAGMNDLIRPALYQGYHEIVPVREPAGSDAEPIDVVGPVCESGDFFAEDRALPALREGDLIALMSAGAYGFAMASNYNSRPLPAEVLVAGSQASLVRRRQTFEDLVREEC